MEGRRDVVAVEVGLVVEHGHGFHPLWWRAGIRQRVRLAGAQALGDQRESAAARKYCGIQVTVPLARTQKRHPRQPVLHYHGDPTRQRPLGKPP
jgi:hypothetical protein